MLFFLFLFLVRFILCIVHDNLCVILTILHVCVSWLSVCCLVIPCVILRVADPYSFFPDPDPEFEAGDQYGSGSGSNPDTRL